MTALPAFRADERLLVLAPHPDDETLATGGLIQLALAAGCAVRVLILTDGDNNPWPQRWLERRWRIDAAARARWGQRRRAEARRALDTLGLAPDALRCLGWPDLGLTDRLLADATAEQAIAAEIQAFAPTRLAAPLLFDRHPDHNALGVLVECALMQVHVARPEWLGFVVHGGPLDDPSARVVLTAEQQHIKQQALHAHVTQVSLSRRRLLALALRPESYAVRPGSSARSLHETVLHVQLPLPRRGPWRRRRELLLVLGTGRSVQRLRLALPARGASLQTAIQTPDGELGVRITTRSDALDVTLASTAEINWGFVKIERSGARLVIYDDDGWHRLADCIAGDHVARAMPPPPTCPAHR